LIVLISCAKEVPTSRFRINKQFTNGGGYCVVDLGQWIGLNVAASGCLSYELPGHEELILLPDKAFKYDRRKEVGLISINRLGGGSFKNFRQYETVVIFSCVPKTIVDCWLYDL
jgi:hypothetical protein